MNWQPRKPRKQLQTGVKAPVNLALERRIENGRRMGLDAKHKRGERTHARVNTPEFNENYDGMGCEWPECRLWKHNGHPHYCTEHQQTSLSVRDVAVIARN